MFAVKENRETRFSIRATPKQKQLILLAAKRSNKTISEFVLENAIEAAEALEQDNANFVLSSTKYEEFISILDKTPCSKPNLKRLLSEPSVFDEK